MVSTPEEKTVAVELGQRRYEITVGAGLIASAGDRIIDWVQARSGVDGTPSAVIVTDENVKQYADSVEASLTAAGWRTMVYAFPPGEASKRLEVISTGWDRMVEFQADRKTVVIAVGGGVVGDAAGFLAASFARGVSFVQVPTTLLADVDSSVGGKVGINHPKAKNLIGAFHQPLGVLIDTSVLETLPDREYRAGLAEVVKYGVILDGSFFSYLEENVVELNQRDPEVLMTTIARCCQLKADVVEKDEQETTGLRAVLNYGHTFGHAYEALSGYGTMLHGEGVSIGMIHASRLANRLGRTETTDTDRQVQLLTALHLPVELPEPLSVRDVVGRMKLDKKTVAGQLRFVLPTKIGHVELVNDVSEEDVIKILQESGLSYETS